MTFPETLLIQFAKWKIYLMIDFAQAIFIFFSSVIDRKAISSDNRRLRTVDWWMLRCVILQWLRIIAWVEYFWHFSDFILTLTSQFEKKNNNIMSIVRKNVLIETSVLNTILLCQSKSGVVVYSMYWISLILYIQRYYTKFNSLSWICPI